MRELKPGARRTKARLQRRQEYADYMQSRAWFERRARWYDQELRRRGVTELECFGGCGEVWTLRDDLHHVSYDRLGEEAHGDLWALCKPCHHRLHDLFERRSWRNISRTVANLRALSILRAEHSSRGHGG